MADKTAKEESLVCLACAGLQEIGDSFNYTDLVQLMIQGKGKVEKHEKHDEVWRNVKIDGSAKVEIKIWGSDPNASGDQYLKTWVNSSVAIAKSLKNDSKSTLRGGDYIFYRQEQFPTGSYADFKTVFVEILKNIKESAKKGNAKEFFDGATMKIYSDDDFKMKPDKWNPADIIAVKRNKVNEWEKNITNFVSKQGSISYDTSKPWNSSSRSSLHGDLEQFTASLRGKKLPGNIRARAEIVLGMQDLYEYNKMILFGLKSGEFVPISLKQTDLDKPPVDLTSVSEPSDIVKFFHMQVKPTEWIYKASTLDALCRFEIKGVPGSDGKWEYAIRQTQSMEQFTDNITNFKKDKAKAFAGSAAMSVVTKIARMSGGRAAFAQLNRKRKELWKKYTPPGMKSPTKGVFWKHTVSKIHGFTDYTVFDKLHIIHKKQMMDASKRSLTREQVGFERRIDEEGRIRPAKKSMIQNEDPTGVVNDVKMWAEYAEWLSASGDVKTTSRQFMKEALGDSQFKRVKKDEQKRIDKKGPYNITMSSVQANYMKRKIQAYEVAWLIDHASSSNPLSEKMKNDILKSIWLYAVSKGFMIFKKSGVKAYLLSGPYLKCAA